MGLNGRDSEQPICRRERIVARLGERVEDGEVVAPGRDHDIGGNVETAPRRGEILGLALELDDPDFVEGIQQMLENAGYAVVIARDGQEAVEKVVGGAFDVLVLDLRLPVLSGLEVYLELKKRDAELAACLLYELLEAIEEAVFVLVTEGLGL